MEENMLSNVLSKIASSILKYCASIANDELTDFLVKKLEYKLTTLIDEEVHNILTNSVSDSVLLENLDDFLQNSGFYPGSQMIYDWSLMAKSTNRIVDEFYSLYPEWDNDRSSITPLLKQIIYETYNASISSLSKENRIQYFQNLRISEYTQETVHKLSEKIDDALQFLKANKCVFDPVEYERYFSDYQMSICYKPFSIRKNGQKYTLDDGDVHKDELFNELERFITYDWKRKLRDQLEAYVKKYTFLEHSINTLSGSLSMQVAVQLLKKSIDDGVESGKCDYKNKNNLVQIIDDVLFNNCMFISGCYGCGKTRLSFEFAKHARSMYNITEEIIFLFVKSETSSNIEENIASAFEQLFSHKYHINQYLDAFDRNYKLVIVLDDVHKYFQNKLELHNVIDIIEKYSRSYVKWIVMTQPGYGNDPADMYSNFNYEYLFQWSREMRNHLIEKWFPLDIWYRLNDTPGKMINKALAIYQWEWKDKVSSTNYYTPLFANTLICYHMSHENERIFSESDLLFPDFCNFFYHLLAGYNDDIELYVGKVINVFLKLRRLELPYGLIKPEDTYHTLYNKGLLLKEKNPRTEITVYEGTPDIIWVYKLAIFLREQYMDERGLIRNSTSLEWEDNKKLFQDILSILVQIAVNTTDNCPLERMKKNWNQLLDKDCCWAVIDSGFNCEPALRNDLIAVLLKRKGIWKRNFNAIMHLCALGKMRNDLLLNVIQSCSNDFRKQTLENGRLFSSMLRLNISVLSWQEIIYAFVILRVIQFDDKTCREIGETMGKALVDQADKVGKIQDAILQACVVSKKPDTELHNKYPADIYDWFCASICDTVISKYEAEGYEIFCRTKWHVCDRRPRWEESHRNKALTFALSDHYRYSLSNAAKIYNAGENYIEWFNGLVDKLKTGNNQEKRFALYLIIHTGLKETGYRIYNNDLVKIAEEIVNNPSMGKIKKEPSVDRFIKTNQIEKHKL